MTCLSYDDRAISVQVGAIDKAMPCTKVLRISKSLDSETDTEQPATSLGSSWPTAAPAVSEVVSRMRVLTGLDKTSETLRLAPYIIIISSSSSSSMIMLNC